MNIHNDVLSSGLGQRNSLYRELLGGLEDDRSRFSVFGCSHYFALDRLWLKHKYPTMAA
jgi:hypothetical protein